MVCAWYQSHDGACTQQVALMGSSGDIGIQSEISMNLLVCGVHLPGAPMGVATANPQCQHFLLIKEKPMDSLLTPVSTTAAS